MDNSIEKKSYLIPNLLVIIGLGFILFSLLGLFTMVTSGIMIAPRNLSNLSRQAVMVLLIAIGMMPIIRSGEIDLSVGALAGFVSVLTAYLNSKFIPEILPGLAPVTNTTICVITGLITGIIIGSVHGILIGFIKFPGFIVTFVSMIILSFGIGAITEGLVIIPINEPLMTLGQGYINISIGILITIVLCIAIIIVTILKIISNKNPENIILQSIGSGISILILILLLIITSIYRGLAVPVVISSIVIFIIWIIYSSTRLSSVKPVSHDKTDFKLLFAGTTTNSFALYPVMGFLAALSGIILTGYLSAGVKSAGSAYLMDAVGICMLAGVIFLSSGGSILSVIIASIIFAVISNGMSLMNVQIFFQYIVKFFIIGFSFGTNLIALLIIKGSNKKYILPLAIGAGVVMLTFIFIFYRMIGLR